MAGRFSWPMEFRTSKPSISGICTSRKIMSGASSLTAATAPLPSEHSPMTSMSASAFRNRLTRLRARGMSSTISVRIFFSILALLSLKGDDYPYCQRCPPCALLRRHVVDRAHHGARVCTGEGARSGLEVHFAHSARAKKAHYLITPEPHSRFHHHANRFRGVATTVVPF